MYSYIQSAFSEEHLYNIRNKFSDENGNNAVDLEVKPQISLSNEDGDVLSPVLEMAKSNRTSM